MWSCRFFVFLNVESMFNPKYIPVYIPETSIYWIYWFYWMDLWMNPSLLNENLCNDI